MKIILSPKMKGNGGKSDRGLITALEQAVEKVLTAQSKS
jgi:hypothetical protein